MFDWLSRAALEMIARGGMGYSFGALNDKADPHPYPAASSDLSYAVNLLNYFVQTFPEQASIVKASFGSRHDFPSSHEVKASSIASIPS